MLKTALLRRVLLPVLGPRIVWKSLSQEREYRFHRDNRWRQSPAFDQHTRELFRYFGFAPTDFRDKLLIDLGAGSRLRTSYFEGARVIAIEPLAERFVEEIQWCDLAAAEEVFAKPAEETIPSLFGQADAVISINVLDHCYDIERIAENVARYLKDGGLAFLSFDSHPVADSMHPLVLDRERCDQAFRGSGFLIRKQSRGLGPLGDHYGHGESLNYWLAKRA